VALAVMEERPLAQVGQPRAAIVISRVVTELRQRTLLVRVAVQVPVHPPMEIILLEQRGERLQRVALLVAMVVIPLTEPRESLPVVAVVVDIKPSLGAMAVVGK
jgi:hypothetical protein